MKSVAAVVGHSGDGKRADILQSRFYPVRVTGRRWIRCCSIEYLWAECSTEKFEVLLRRSISRRIFAANAAAVIGKPDLTYLLSNTGSRWWMYLDS